MATDDILSELYGDQFSGICDAVNTETETLDTDIATTISGKWSQPLVRGSELHGTGEDEICSSDTRIHSDDELE
jgi:hypothetical protein